MTGGLISLRTEIDSFYCYKSKSMVSIDSTAQKRTGLDREEKGADAGQLEEQRGDEARFGVAAARYAFETCLSNRSRQREIFYFFEPQPIDKSRFGKINEKKGKPFCSPPIFICFLQFEQSYA